MNLPPPVQARWNSLAPREKTWVLLALALVSLSLLWWILLAPALKTWQSAEAQHRSLDAQLQKMRALQTQAQALQSQPKLVPEEVLRLLDASVKQQLGVTAQLSVSRERATITLKGVSAEALAQWLAQTRINARLLPAEARLSRSASAKAGWDGSIVLILPAR